MAWHKQKQYDPVEAFVQNVRQQKLLDLELQEIDKLWFTELKRIAKQRLDVTSELNKLEETKRTVDHYDKTMLVSDLKPYTDNVIEQFRKLNKENTRDNFNFETCAMKEKRLSVSLPSLNFIGLAAKGRRVSVKPGKKKSRVKHRKQRTGSCTTGPNSKLKGTKIKSISDSNLHTSSTFKETLESERISSNSAHAKRSKEEKSSSALPRIGGNKLTSAKSDDHRYLKQKMATTLELPPVVEINTQRKMSV